MTDKQPEALRLADAIDPLTRERLDNLTCAVAAAELRRLHEVNAELVEALKAALSDDQPYIVRAKAAIAKATGEQQ